MVKFPRLLKNKNNFVYQIKPYIKLWSLRQCIICITKQIYNWTTVENPKPKPSIYGYLIYDMDDIANHCGKGRC